MEALRIVRASLLSTAVALAVLTIGCMPIMINYGAAATVLATDRHESGKGLPATGSPQPTEGDQSTGSDNGNHHDKPETVQPSAEATQDPDADPPSPIIHEDDPRWDCTSMGNLQCGPSQPAEASLANTGINVIGLAMIGAALCVVGAVGYFISLMLRHPER